MNTFKINIAISGFLLCAILASCKYDNAEDLKYQNWRYLNTQNSKLPSDYIYCLRLDSKGNVWALCGKNYVARIDPFLNISIYEIPFSDSIDVNSKLAFTMEIDKYDKIWVGARTNPLYYLEHNFWHKMYIKNLNAQVRSIGFDENNNLWLGTVPQGLFQQVGDSMINYNYYNSNIPSGEVFNILVNNSKLIYIMTEITPPIIGTRSTVCIFDGNTFKVIVGHNDTTAKYGSFSFILKDQATMALGGKYEINEFTNDQFNQFGDDSLYIKDYFSPSDFIYDKKTGYWIASALGLTNIQQSKSKLYNTKNSGLTGENLNSIVLDNNRNLFISVFGKGLAIYHLIY